MEFSVSYELNFLCSAPKQLAIKNKTSNQRTNTCSLLTKKTLTCQNSSLCVLYIVHSHKILQHFIQIYTTK